MSTLPDAESAQQQLLISALCASNFTVRLLASKLYTATLLEPPSTLTAKGILLAKYLPVTPSDDLIPVRGEFTTPDTKLTGGQAPATRR